MQRTVLSGAAPFDPRLVRKPNRIATFASGSVGLLVHFLTEPFHCYPEAMEVQPTPGQKEFIRQAIESGRLHREEDALKEALSLWEERERTRAEILAAVDDAEASLVRGEGRMITQQSMRELAEDVKQRGRARLVAEQPAPH